LPSPCRSSAWRPAMHHHRRHRPCRRRLRPIWRRCRRRPPSGTAVPASIGSPAITRTGITGSAGIAPGTGT